MNRLFALVALLLAALALPAHAQNYPARPDGPVLDQANIIPAGEEAALDRKLRDYNAATGRAIVVATVNSLDGEPIETYTRNLAEQWDIGGAETEEGVLMLVAPNEREIFIATARGVQGRLTDISTGRIVRNTIIPAFKNGDMPGGITAGVDQIVERLNMDPAQAEAIAEAEAAAERERASEGGFPIGGLIWIAFIFFFFILPMMRRGRRYSRRGGLGRTASDIILWEVGSAIAREAMRGGSGGGSSWGGGSSGGFGGGFGGFGGGGGGFNGGGAGGSW